MTVNAQPQQATVHSGDEVGASVSLLARLRSDVGIELAAREAADRIERLEKDAAIDKQRLDAFISWFLRDGTKKEINPLGHIRATSREDIVDWLDAEISTSDPVVVKQLVKALQDLCDEPRSQKLVGGQVYRTAKELIAQYSCSTYSDNPISTLVHALKDFVDMAKMYRMDDSAVFRNGNALISKYAFKARTA